MARNAERIPRRGAARKGFRAEPLESRTQVHEEPGPPRPSRGNARSYKHGVSPLLRSCGPGSWSRKEPIVREFTGIVWHDTIAALACLAGCTHAGSGERSGITPKPLRFIFITTCVDEDFFKPVKKGVCDAAAQVGVQCTFTGTPEVDIKAQAEMVRKAVAEGYDGIALNIIDPVAFDGVVSEAMGKGIPVVAFNVDDKQTPNERLSGVCQDSKAGRIVGERSAAFIPDKSRSR